MGATATYPNLGFDPCPGNVDSVSALQQKINTAATSMQQANDLMNRLRNDQSAVWQGEAGDAFRQHLNSTLIEDLGKANQSLNQAMSTLRGWGGSLTGYQQRAAALEQEAAQAVQELNAARERQQQAAGNPDLQLAGQYFATDEELQGAQRRLDSAALALRNATEGLNAAEDRLEAVRKKARDLHDEWDEAASRAAEALKDAAKFAPHKPGLLSRLGQGIAHAVDAVGDWVMDHLDDIHAVLSTISAISGLIALCTPPPIDAIALGVSLVAGAGALVTTLADPKVRKDLGEVLHGDFSGNWGSVLQLGGDVIGLVPGVGVATKSIKAGSELFAEGARGFPTIVEIGSAVAHDPGFVMKQVAKIPKVGDVLEAARILEPGAQRIEGAVADGANFVNKTIGSAKKTIKTVWGEVTGDGDD
ncbi:putative T7SS-secreted protein [Actinoplanes sp. CA-030573]|uniref:putative T7SS-secreted protein n=1 Tax=Actinoplanes sp. CA-030573 TaxID=3239898 RepID=UPI003D921819